MLVDVKTNTHITKRDSLSAANFLDSLAQHNFYFTEVKKVEHEGDIVKIFYDKGQNFNHADVTLSDSVRLYTGFQQNFFTKNLDSLRRKINENVAEQGFSFSRVISRYNGIKDGIPKVTLSIKPGARRQISSIVYKNFTKIPRRFKSELEKKYSGKVYGHTTIERLRKEFQNHPYLTLENPPQTLFTKNSTQIYLTVQKRRASSFDGVIGFGNDQSEKVTFNGTLNLDFRNIFNGFESISIYWQRNPERGQNFDMKADVPYLFGSALGLNIQTNIYRQDSVFANAKFLPAAYISFKNKHKAGVRGNFETSSVSDNAAGILKNYSKKGVGIWYEYLEVPDEIMFLYKTRLHLDAGFNSVAYEGDPERYAQTNLYLTAERNQPLGGHHFLNLKGEGGMINSDRTLYTNELFRFGGWNSLRGFGENTLVADKYFFAGAEYRYLIGDDAFADVFGQYGYLQNKILDVDPKFYSFGFGFNYRLPIGIMSLQISNGTQSGQEFRFNATKIHWGIVSRF